MKKRILVLFVLLLMLLECTVLADEIPKAVLDVKNSTVRIFVKGYFYYYNSTTRDLSPNPYTSGSGKGTGICVGEKGKNVKYVVTNRHVVEPEVIQKKIDYPIGYNCLYWIPYDYSVVLDNNGKIISANVLEMNTGSNEADLAVLELAEETNDRIPIAIRDFKIEDLKDNDAVFTLGYPADNTIDTGAAYPASGTDKCVVQSGNIQSTLTRAASYSNQEVGYRGEQINHDANMSPGNSGGPLVDKNGLLIGINTFGATKTIKNTSISANEIREVLDRQKIPYTIVKSGIPMTYLLGSIILVLLIIIILVVVGQGKKKKPKDNETKIEEAVNSGNKRFIRCDKGEAAGKIMELPLNKEVIIGRDSNCNFKIPDTDKTRHISRQHCSLIFDGQNVTVKDLNSSAHTYVYDGKNGLQEIPSGSRKHLHRGQELRLGNDSSRPMVLTLHAHQ